VFHTTKLERLASDKNSSLLGPFISYEENELLCMTPGCPLVLGRTLGIISILLENFLVLGTLVSSTITYYDHHDCKSDASIWSITLESSITLLEASFSLVEVPFVMFIVQATKCGVTQ